MCCSKNVNLFLYSISNINWTVTLQNYAVKALGIHADNNNNNNLYVSLTVDIERIEASEFFLKKVPEYEISSAICHL